VEVGRKDHSVPVVVQDGGMRSVRKRKKEGNAKGYVGR
jgi:hypothetical protein